jgi:hypothetical protein
MVPVADPGRAVNPDVQPRPPASPLAGQIAHRVADPIIFPRYLSEKSAHPSQRHARGTRARPLHKFTLDTSDFMV